MNAYHELISAESNGADLMYLLGMAKAYYDCKELSTLEYQNILNYLFLVRGGKNEQRNK